MEDSHPESNGAAGEGDVVGVPHSHITCKSLQKKLVGEIQEVHIHQLAEMGNRPSDVAGEPEPESEAEWVCQPLHTHMAWPLHDSLLAVPFLEMAPALACCLPSSLEEVDLQVDQPCMANIH